MEENKPLNLEQLILEISDADIKSMEESMKEMEEALLSNVEWPSEKQKDEIRLLISKNEKEKGWKGWFWKKIRQRAEDRLKRNNYKPPEKLSKECREFLEEKVRENKNTITFWKNIMASRPVKDMDKPQKKKNENEKEKN